MPLNQTHKKLPWNTPRRSLALLGLFCIHGLSEQGIMFEWQKGKSTVGSTTEKRCPAIADIHTAEISSCYYCHMFLKPLKYYALSIQKELKNRRTEGRQTSLQYFSNICLYYEILTELFFTDHPTSVDTNLSEREEPNHIHCS